MAGRKNYGLWTGDVYKSIIWFKNYHNHIPCFVLDIDYGCGIIHKTKKLNKCNSDTIIPYNKLDYNWLLKNLDKLNLKTIEFLETYLERIEL